METNPSSQPAPNPGIALAQRLQDLIHGNWTTLCIKAAIELGVFDALARGPGDAAMLSAALGTDADSLARLLRALVSLELCERSAAGQFSLTALGGLLVSGSAGSLADWARFWSGPTAQLWQELDASVRHGRSIRQLRCGTAGFEHLGQDAGRARLFNAAMISLSHWVARSFAEHVDLGSSRHLVDVGGGHGELLAQVLLAHPALRGTLFDLPHATRDAAAHLASHGIGERAAVVSGDFFDDVPGDADVHVLKSVLHNWPDEPALALLRRCRRAVEPAGRLFVVERLLPDAFAAQPADRELARSDLNMMVALGARERTLARYRELLAAAGFEIRAVTRLAMAFHAIEARPA